MTFDEILTKVRERAAAADISGVDFFAAQIDITGDNGGVFYVEVKDGRISVEPYEYYDRQVRIIVGADDLLALMSGKLDPIAGFTAGKIKVEGDPGRALQFSSFVKKK